MIEPKPCPFCGCQPLVSSYEYTLPSGKVYATQWKVECESHDCPTQPTADWHYFTRDEAIEAWNRRYLDQSDTSDKLRELVRDMWTGINRAYVRGRPLDPYQFEMRLRELGIEVDE